MESDSAPALVDPTDFGLTDETYNKQTFAKLRYAKPMVMSSITLRDGSKAKLYKTGDGQNGAVFIEYECKLGLYIEYNTYKYPFLPVRALTQTKLWRDPDLPVTNTFSQRLFFNIMLSMTGAVMSDAEHTEYRRDFWKRRLGEALQKHLNVALVDFGSKTFEQITGLKALEAKFREVWSADAMKKARYLQLRWLVWKPDA